MAQFRSKRPKKKYFKKYYVQMAYPTQNKYYNMDMENTKAKAEASVRKMKKEGYGGMKFRIKPSTKKFLVR
jgi:hypothetical protein